MSQVTDVTGDLLRRGAKTGNGVGNVLVYLAAVRLGRNAVAGREAKLFAEQLVQILDLLGVSLEDL